MKKAIFFVSHLDSGGIENYLLRFLQYKAEAFSEIVVFCKNGKDGQLDKEYLQIPNVRLKKQYISFFNPLHYMRLIRYFMQERFDVVCDFTGNFSGFILWCAKQAKIKNRIAFYRGSTNHFEESFFKLAYNKLVNKLVCKYATSILSNSQSAFYFFFKKTDTRFDVIYNGINAKEFLTTKENLREELNIPEDAFVISNVGRFVESKNHKAVIDVATKLCKQNKNIYFLLCGKDVIMAFKNYIEEREIQKQVKLLDFRKDVIKVLNTSDAFYFPSYTEGQPNALIEALIVGLPFVASDITSIKETIPEAFHHLLVNADDIEKASKLLEKMYLDKVFRKNIDLSRWAIENYNASKMFEKFYDKL